MGSRPASRRGPRLVLAAHRALRGLIGSDVSFPQSRAIRRRAIAHHRAATRPRASQRCRAAVSPLRPSLRHGAPASISPGRVSRLPAWPGRALPSVGPSAAARAVGRGIGSLHPLARGPRKPYARSALGRYRHDPRSQSPAHRVRIAPSPARSQSGAKRLRCAPTTQLPANLSGAAVAGIAKHQSVGSDRGESDLAHRALRHRSLSASTRSAPSGGAAQRREALGRCLGESANARHAYPPMPRVRDGLCAWCRNHSLAAARAAAYGSHVAMPAAVIARLASTDRECDRAATGGAAGCALALPRGHHHKPSAF